ncbi:YwqG family protein, partial [Vagococcus martis]
MKELETILYNYLPEEDVKQILKSKRQFISLDLVDEPTNLYSSKIGGYGYLPKSISYPTNKNNQPLSLLAQLNFEELPTLEPFPKKGILAFYIDCFDDVWYGLDDDNPTIQVGFRTIYMEDLTKKYHSISEQQSLFGHYSDEELWGIVSKETKLNGRLSETVSITDTVDFQGIAGVPYYEYIESKISGYKERDEFEELKFNILEDIQSRTCVGGYPFFTQSDPRGYDTKLSEEYNTLLFQLNSDDDIVMWGDTGVGNFFINDEKLKNKD